MNFLASPVFSILMIPNKETKAQRSDLLKAMQLVDDRAGTEPRRFGSRTRTLKYNTIHTIKVKTGARDLGTC